MRIIRDPRSVCPWLHLQLVQGSCGLFPEPPCPAPCQLQEGRTGGTGTCCLFLWRMLQAGQDAAPGIRARVWPCPVLSWSGGGSHGSSSRLGVLGQVFKKGWWPFELASGTGLPLDWSRVLAYLCLSSREGSRKVLGHAGTARSSVGAHGAEKVLGASASPSCLSQKPPQQPRLLPGVLCLFQLSLGRVRDRKSVV